MATFYVYGIYVSGSRVGPKYTTRDAAMRDAASFRASYRGEKRRPTIRVKRIVDR